MSWRKDFAYKLYSPDTRTTLLCAESSNVSGGILSLTFLGGIGYKTLQRLERKALVVYGYEQGTGKSEILLVLAKLLPRKFQKHLQGSVGCLPVQTEPNELVAILATTSAFHEAVSCFWLHFHFE